MVTFEKFKEEALQRGVCADFKEKFVSCRSKKQLMDMALNIKGLEYLCDAITKGWGISADVISTRFAPYINGGYKYESPKGYTSEMYCCCVGEEVKCRSTALCLIDCDITLKIPNNCMCEVYVVGKCKIKVESEGRVFFVVYDESTQINICDKDKDRVKVKFIDK